MISDVRRRIVVDAVQNPDFSLANRHGHAMVIQHGNPADFQCQSVRGRFPRLGSRIRLGLRCADGNEFVVIAFRLRRCVLRMAFACLNGQPGNDQNVEPSIHGADLSPSTEGNCVLAGGGGVQLEVTNRFAG